MFDVTNFNKLETVTKFNSTSAGKSAKIIYADGTSTSLSGTQTLNISSKTGEAYFRLTSSCKSGGSQSDGTYYTSSGEAKITKAVLRV